MQRRSTVQFKWINYPLLFGCTKLVAAAAAALCQQLHTGETHQLYFHSNIIIIDVY